MNDEPTLAGFDDPETCMSCDHCGPECPPEPEPDGSRTLSHAKREFKALGYKPVEESTDEEDGPNKWIQENVFELLEVFSKQGHSGTSAPFCVDYFSKLALFEPLSPLTGEDWEWNEVGPGVFQNNRCSHVFHQADRFNGRPYDINGKVFWEKCVRDLEEDEEGYPGIREYKSYFTSSDSFVLVEFPYTPTQEYIEVIPDSECLNCKSLIGAADNKCVRCGRIYVLTDV
jgi:ferredoxin